ncbi:MAG: Ig-like domain-containing protein [Chitinophagales bacterium]
MKNIPAMSFKRILPLFLTTLFLVTGFHIAQAQSYIAVTDDYYEIQQNLPLDMELFANDTLWTSNDTVIWTLITEPNFGTVAPENPMIIPPAMPPFLPTTPVWVLNNSSSIFTYQLEDIVGEPFDSFTYSVCDFWGFQCDTATVSINIMLTGVDPVSPEAVPDAAVTLMSVPVEIDALANDLDMNVPPSLLTLISVTAPDIGMAAIQNNKILYTPADDYFGTEQFSYTIENEYGLSSTTWVTVVVGEATVGLIDAVDDVYDFEMDLTQVYLGVPLYNISGFVLQNFGITENDAFNPTSSITFCSTPQFGTISAMGTDDVPQSSTSVQYIPNTPGVETLCYEICDDFLGECDEATITINITTNPDDPVLPTAYDDFYQSPIPDPITMNVMANDVFDINANISVNIGVPQVPLIGSVFVTNSNLIIYTPDPAFMGVETFIYQLCDVATGYCSEATVTVEISDEPFPDEVIAIDDFENYIYGTTIIIDVLSNDSGPNIELTEVHNPVHGSAIINDDQTISYALISNNAPPEDYFNYVICSNSNPVECDTATVFLQMGSGFNQPPIANTDIVYTHQGIPVVIDILANDDDPDSPNEDLMIQPLISEYPEGMVSVMSNNTIVFTPEADFTGDFVFTYTICSSDVPEDCGSAEVVIHVIDNNDGPLQAEDDFFVLDDSTIGDLQLTIFANDVTTENTSIYLLGMPANGHIFWGFNPAEPPFYAPNDPDFTGVDSLFYIICDDTIDDCDAAMIYINVTGTGNVVIDAIDDYVATAVDNSITIPIFNNDVFDINSYNLANVSTPNNGTVAIAESFPEQISYAPNLGFEGQDQFNYTICDVATGECDTATVFIEVGSGLVAVDDYIVIENYSPQNLDLQSNDIYAGMAIITNFTQPASGSVGCDPAAIPCVAFYTPNPGFEGSDSFEYVICDNFSGICDTAMVYLTIGVDCSTGCVWSGDANNDGTANNFDILAVGLGFGETGTSRIGASNDWYPQPSADWMQEITTFTTSDEGLTFDSITINAKYADCNGNGVIEGSDIEAISQNYGLTHAKKGEKQAAADAPSITFSLPEEIPANTWITVDVLLGSEEQVAEDIYGLAFTINYDADVVELGSVNVDFEENSWFDDGNNIGLAKDFGETGKIDIGYSRVDGQSISGYGKIATFSIFVIDNVSGKKSTAGIPFNISASGALVVNSEGFVQAMNTEPAESIVTSIDEIDLSAMNFYPNPSANQVFFNFGGLDIQTLKVFNAMGQLMYNQSFEVNTSKTTLNVNNWHTGFYFVHFQTPDGIGTRRFQVLR